MNRGTYGAAELAADAIGGAKRGDLVGERTFGEGSVQKTIELPDGAALILTVAKYEGPDGKKIQDDAVTPTLQVGQAAEDDLEDGATPPKGDEPLNKALELLKSKNGKASTHFPSCNRWCTCVDPTASSSAGRASLERKSSRNAAHLSDSC